MIYLREEEVVILQRARGLRNLEDRLNVSRKGKDEVLVDKGEMQKITSSTHQVSLL
jgi:hypothetical protein